MESHKPRNTIGLVTSVSLVTATMVGTGVYTSLGFQLLTLQGGFPILCLWAAGGFISLCGALSYAELASRIPSSGGEYTYLSAIYHPALGFMAAFVSLIAGFTAPIALAAMAFGAYLHAAFPSCQATPCALLAVILISLFHLRSLRVSALAQNIMTGAKFLIVVVFMGVGLRGILSHPDLLALLQPDSGSFDALLQPESGVALLFVLYAYSGWNATTYLAGEVTDRQKTVGLSLVIGTLLVTLLYLGLNAVFLTAAPSAELRGVLNVGSVAASHLLGSKGGAIMSGIIALGLLASISAMIWAGPRVTQRVGSDYIPFRSLALKSDEGIPCRAVLLQLLLVLILILTGSFESVLIYTQIPLLLCLTLGVAGLFVLRRRNRRRGLEPAFRCPLFPLPPLLFIFCGLCGLVYSAISKPWSALSGLGTMLIPLAIFPWVVSVGNKSADRP